MGRQRQKRGPRQFNALVSITKYRRLITGAKLKLSALRTSISPPAPTPLILIPKLTTSAETVAATGTHHGAELTPIPVPAFLWVKAFPICGSNRSRCPRYFFSSPRPRSAPTGNLKAPGFFPFLFFLAATLLLVIKNTFIACKRRRVSAFGKRK